MKKQIAFVCLLLSSAVMAQSPNAKVLVLEKDQGEERVRPPREGVATAPVGFVLKVTPQNSGSKHLVMGTETIPSGGTVPKHRHLGQDEIVFLQTGTARVTLNDKDYDLHAGGMIFAPMNTWIALQNTGKEDIQLIFIFSAPGFEDYMRCTSVPAGQRGQPLSLDQLRDCAHKGNVDYEALSGHTK